MTFETINDARIHPGFLFVCKKEKEAKRKKSIILNILFLTYTSYNILNIKYI